MELQRPILGVAHREPRMQPVFHRGQQRTEQTEGIGLGLSVAHRRGGDLAQDRDRRLARGVGLHARERSERLQGFDAVQFAPLALHPRGRNPGHRRQSPAETAAALARRRADTAHAPMMLGEQGHDEIRFAELGRAQHIRLVTILPHEARMIAGGGTAAAGARRSRAHPGRADRCANRGALRHGASRTPCAREDARCRRGPRCRPPSRSHRPFR